MALLPVTEDEHASAAALAEDLHRAGVRADVDRAEATLGARIRAAVHGRVPVVGVLAACRDATDGRTSQVAL